MRRDRNHTCDRAAIGGSHASVFAHLALCGFIRYQQEMHMQHWRHNLVATLAFGTLALAAACAGDVGSTSPVFLTSKLIAQGGEDQYGPQSSLLPWYDALAEPKSLAIISGADHFFTGHLQEMRDALQQWVRDVIQPVSPVPV